MGKLELTIILIVMLIAIISLAMVFQKSVYRKQNKTLVKLYNSIYNTLSNKYIFAGRLHSLRTRIYNNTLDEDWMIKYKVIAYIFLSWGIGLIATIFIFIFFKNNLYVTFVLLFFAFQIKEMFLDILIGDDTVFISDIAEYSTELQQSFNLTKDVRSALIEANNNYDNYNLIKRMEEVERIIDDTDQMREYIRECPNDYLKLLNINCTLVNENGDKKDVDDKSVFLENIFYNNQNIEMEVFKRDQLDFWLRGMKMACILPLLVFSPYEWWAHKFFPVTDIFLKTQLGFITKLIITAVVIIAYYLIKSFERSNKRIPIKEKKIFWENLFFKIPFIKRFILLIVPKINSSRGYKYRKLINKSGEYTKVEYIFLRKVIFSIIGFILSISICLSLHVVSKNSILENNTSEFTKTIIITNNGQADSTAIEKEVLKEVDIKNIEGSYNRVKSRLQSYGINEELDIVTKKIVFKAIALNDEHLSLVDILISILFSILGYNLPEAILKIKIRMRKYEMENEVLIFETIVLIFMYHENATSEVILEHMLDFSNVFKSQIEEILKELRKSDFVNLEMIVDEIKYKPFLNLIKNIIKAENIKAKDAFISLADNRRNYLMNKKEANQREVYKSTENGRKISYIPTLLVIVVYIVGSMVLATFKQLDETQEKLMQFESGKPMYEENINQK